MSASLDLLLSERPLRILLITGEASARHTYSKQLQAISYGTDLHEAASLDEAVAQAAAHDPEVILLDAHGLGQEEAEIIRLLHERLSPVPPLLLLLQSTEDVPASLPGMAMVLPRTASPSEALCRAAVHLVKGHRLGRALEEARAEQRRLTVELERLGVERRDAQEASRRVLAEKRQALRSPLHTLLGHAERLQEALTRRGDEALLDDVQEMLRLGRQVVEAVEDLTAPAPSDGGATAAAGPEPYRREVPAPATSGSPAPTADLLLIIDDDDVLRNLMAQYLETEGFEVITAPDGEEGLRMARELQPAAITLDVEMPGMNGWEVLGVLKADAALARTPVVMLTGRGSEHVAAQALRQGVDDYLMKSDITAPALRKALAGVIERARLRTARPS